VSGDGQRRDILGEKKAHGGRREEERRTRDKACRVGLSFPVDEVEVETLASGRLCKVR
jgi:hypothetical protein